MFSPEFAFVLLFALYILHTHSKLHLRQYSVQITFEFFFFFQMRWSYFSKSFSYFKVAGSFFLKKGCQSSFVIHYIPIWSILCGSLLESCRLQQFFLMDQINGLMTYLTVLIFPYVSYKSNMMVVLGTTYFHVGQ